MAIRSKFTSALLLGFQLFSFCQTDTLGKLVRRYYNQSNFNGIVLVAQNGKINLLQASGIASRRFDLPINLKSRFRIASVTKTFTAVMLMQFVERGIIDLDQTIGKYLPDYKGEARDLTTIRQLLTYCSGMPNCEKKSGDTIYQIPQTVDQFISRYCSEPLDTIPGKVFNYDNGDYILLGRILENVSGKSFAELLNEKILKPLNLKSTGLLRSDSIVANLAETYLYDDSAKAFFSDPPYYIENYFAAGAMYSSVEDLFLFDQAIFNGQLLSRRTLEKMLMPNPALGNVAIGFWASSGYGAIDHLFYYRPGGIYGATANWIHVTEPNTTIIVLSNTNATNLFEFSQQLYSAGTKQFPGSPNKNNDKH